MSGQETILNHATIASFRIPYNLFTIIQLIRRSELVTASLHEGHNKPTGKLDKKAVLKSGFLTQR
jgi:hypothetical protein